MLQVKKKLIKYFINISIRYSCSTLKKILLTISINPVYSVSIIATINIFMNIKKNHMYSFLLNNRMVHYYNELIFIVLINNCLLNIFHFIDLIELVICTNCINKCMYE